MARALYSLLWFVVLPLALLRLWWRGRAEPGYRLHWAERFGVFPAAPETPCLWLHAVSLGETNAAAPLIDGLLRALPGHAIVLTHTTATGRRAGAELAARHAGRLVQCWLPYDTPWYARRFLRHFRPRLGVVMETEVWPNLMHAAHAGGVPMVLANARLSARSARGYARWRALTRPAFAAFGQVLAQSQADAARLAQCGARAVQVSGNLKFDVAVDVQQLREGEAWRARQGKPVIVAASTREGEEELLLAAWKQVAQCSALLVLVPRHPQRFAAVAAAARNAGYSVECKSACGLETSANCQVLVGDTVGEMALYYGLADVVIMGGSLLDHGSQNFIEACACGRPVVLGRSTYNFALAAELAIAAGAAWQTPSAEPAASCREAVQHALDVASSPQQPALRQRALQFVAMHRGALARQLSAVLQALPAAPAADRPAAH
jgi:3-deoxy-D-manno-octulosonic-acid transferase